MEVNRVIDLINDKMCFGRGTFSAHHMPEHDEYWQAGEMAIEALEKQERDRWVPVTERLPKEDGNYLVTYEKGFAEDYGLDPIGIAPFEVDCEGFGIWVENFDKMTLGSLGCDWTEIKVVAWRPLPELYEGL